jgi:transposase
MESRAPPQKPSGESMTCSQQEIKTHTERVELGTPIFYGQGCPHCGNHSRGNLKPHDCRSRTFRLIIEGYVKVMLSWIVRWNCSQCGGRFTDYPPFRLTP